MLDFFSGTVGTVVLIIAGLLIVFILIMSMWKKVPQNLAAVVTGMKRRVITGGGGLVLPFLERIDYLSLGNITLEVVTEESISSQGVPVGVQSTAVIKVKNEHASILAAAEQFPGRNPAEIEDGIKAQAKNVLEGKLREIVSKKTVEELYRDRESFASDVQDVISTELQEMGLEIKSFTIKDINDRNGYIDALGVKQISEKKKEAAIAKAEADRDQMIKTSLAKREGEAARLEAETKIAEAEKLKTVQQAEYRREQDKAKAIADASYSIQQNITQKEVTSAEMDAEVLRQQRLKDVEAERVQIEIVKEQKNIELEQKRAERAKNALQADVVEPALAEKAKQQAMADAERYKQIAEAEALAEARRKQGEAEAEVIKKTGEAEADAIRQKGIAEAEAMEKKAEAYKKYNNAAMANMMIDVLPAIAEKVAQPLSQIDKVVVLEGGSGDGASGVTNVAGNVTSIMAGLFESVKEMTGVDLKEVVRAQTYDAKVNKNIHVTGLEKPSEEK